MENNINLVLYAIRNNEGKFFRAKGYGGSGNTWVNDINKAKIYGKIGGARGVITWFSNNFSSYPSPELLKLTVTGVEVMDEKGRIEKAKQKKLIKENNRIKAAAERKLKEAYQDLDKALINLKNLRNT